MDSVLSLLTTLCTWQGNHAPSRPASVIRKAPRATDSTTPSAPARRPRRSKDRIESSPASSPNGHWEDWGHSGHRHTSRPSHRHLRPWATFQKQQRIEVPYVALSLWVLLRNGLSLTFLVSTPLQAPLMKSTLRLIIIHYLHVLSDAFLNSFSFSK